MDEGAVECRHGRGARVYSDHYVSISGSGPRVGLCLAVDQQSPEQGEQEGSPWDTVERVLTMHAMGRYFIITPSNGNTMSQFQSSHTKRGLNL